MTTRQGNTTVFQLPEEDETEWSINTNNVNYPFNIEDMKAKSPTLPLHFDKKYLPHRQPLREGTPQSQRMSVALPASAKRKGEVVRVGAEPVRDVSAGQGRAHLPQHQEVGAAALNRSGQAEQDDVPDGHGAEAGPAGGGLQPATEHCQGDAAGAGDRGGGEGDAVADRLPQQARPVPHLMVDTAYDHQIFQESRRQSLSKGMVMVSTMPGPQQRHSAASMPSISSFLARSSFSSFSTEAPPSSSSRRLFQMLRAFMKENPLLPFSCLCCRCSVRLRAILSSRERMSWESTSTWRSLWALGDGWALVAAWRQDRWKPCMQGKMQNSRLKRGLKHSSHLWLESISMQRFLTMRSSFLSCSAFWLQLSIRCFSRLISPEQLFSDSQISSLKFSILMFWLKKGSRSSILTTLLCLVSSMTSLTRPFLTRQCLAMSIHSFFRSSSYSGFQAYSLAISSLLFSRAKATASPYRYIFPQTMICGSTILQFLNSRSPKSRSKSSRPAFISWISSGVVSLGEVTQKNIRMLWRLFSLVRSQVMQQRRRSMPWTRWCQGMFMRPGMSLMGLKSRTDLVSRAAVRYGSKRKKMWLYLQTTSTTLGSLTLRRYSRALSQASSLRQCITIISKLFLRSAKLIRFWMRPWDCIIRYTMSSLIAPRLSLSPSSSSSSFFFSRSRSWLPSRSSRFSRYTISSISHDTSRQRWLFWAGSSFLRQACKQSYSPCLASSESACRNFRNISSKLRSVSLKYSAAFWQSPPLNRLSAYMPATQLTFSFLALQTVQASLNFLSSSSSFQASSPSWRVSSLVTPLLLKIQKVAVLRSKAMSLTRLPLNSSCTTSFCVIPLMMVMLSWNSRQQWKSVTPMLIGASCTWYAFASDMSTRLANFSASCLLRKLSLRGSFASGMRMRTRALLLAQMMAVGLRRILEQQIWLMDWQLRGISTSLIFYVWFLQAVRTGSRSSGPVRHMMEELVERMTITQCLLLAWVTRRMSTLLTSLLRYSWYCSAICSRRSPLCSRSIRYSNRMPPSTDRTMSPERCSVQLPPWKATALMLMPFSSFRRRALLSLKLRQQFCPPSATIMQCQPLGSMYMLRMLAARSLLVSKPKKFSLLVSGSSQALNQESTLTLHLYSLFDSVTMTLVSYDTTSLLIFQLRGTPGSSDGLKTKVSSSCSMRGSKPLSSTSSSSIIALSLPQPQSLKPQASTCSSSSSESLPPWLVQRYDILIDIFYEPMSQQSSSGINGLLFLLHLQVRRILRACQVQENILTDNETLFGLILAVLSQVQISKSPHAKGKGSAVIRTVESPVCFQAQLVVLYSIFGLIAVAGSVSSEQVKVSFLLELHLLRSLHKTQQIQRFVVVEPCVLIVLPLELQLPQCARNSCQLSVVVLLYGLVYLYRLDQVQLTSLYILFFVCLTACPL